MSRYNDTLRRFQNVIIGARVGDAMGTPTEELSPDQIGAQFGWLTTFEGDGTDDSLMATILAETLVASGGTATLDDWAEQLLAHHSEVLEKADKFFPSVLHLVEKLKFGYLPSQVAVGNMPSTSSAMCIWPVGLVNAGNPAEAARQALELARLIHTNEVDACTDGAAALAAAIAAAFVPGATIRSTLDAAIGGTRRLSGREMSETIVRAVALADDCASYVDFRTEFHRSFARPIVCDALETVPAALALCALADGDLSRAVEYGANFGRDTDTIASMSGALCGALADEIPPAWIDTLGDEALEATRELSVGLRDAGVAKRLMLTAQLSGARESVEAGRA